MSHTLNKVKIGQAIKHFHGKIELGKMLSILFIEALAFVLQIIYFSACGCYTVISGFPF